MANMVLVAWAFPYELPLIVYIGQEEETSDQIYEKAQATISILPSDEDFKVLIYNTLCIGSRAECEKAIFQGVKH